MNKEIAINIENISKTFRIPHEKVTSVKGAVTSAFKKGGYEEFKALDGVSFEVKKGEFFGIIGRNGSGKSTLLKVLSGIYQADQGKVKIDGMISPFLELGIGFNPELSGRDNVYLNATVLGMTKKQIDEKFDSIVAFSELERFIDQKLKNYSSGMQVRLAFSVSIHANRDILLMDEVLAVGDLNFQSKCLEEFNKYREMGRTVVIVTHDISVVERYCDRAMLLRNGKIVKIGNADDVANEYVNENMKDEENRLSQENLIKLKKENFKINKIAEITNVEFFDKSGKNKSVFKTGDFISVKISFKRNIPTKKINVGVGLYSSDNSYLFSYNTQMDKYELDENIDSVTLKFENISLLKGIYYLNFICFGDIEQRYYDFKPRFKNIEIYSTASESSYRGFLSIKHEWLS